MAAINDATELKEEYKKLGAENFDPAPILDKFGDEETLYENEICDAGHDGTDAMLRLILKERGAARDGGA